MLFNWNSDKEEREILLVKHGDAAAMRNLYERHIGYLTAVCSRYVAEQDDVRDVLQDSFVKIFDGIGGFEYRGKGSVRAWMTRVVVNESLSYLRRTDRPEVSYPEWELPDVAEEDSPDTLDITPEAIQEMVMKLPRGYRTVFCLYVFEHKSHKEIADSLGIRPDTSASQFHKAKDMLRGFINEYKTRNHG